MADAVVGQLVNRLVQVVDENVVLIKEIKNQVDTLVGDLKSLEAYLKQASKKQSASDNDVLKDVVDKIRGVVSDAEDAISKYTVERKKYKDKGWVRCFQSPAYYARVKASAKEIQGIIEKVQRIRTNHANDLKELIQDNNPKDQPAALPIMAPVVEEVDVVGFDGEATTIKNLLKGGSNDLTVISIEGMAGLGKTTLTKMVFEDRDIQFEFFTRLWVYVSKTFNRRQIFLDILSSFTKTTKDFQNMSDQSLVDKIKEYLKGGKYFIVVDDVWRENDWDCLKIAFPDSKNGSRVLLTTRHHTVASHADSTRDPHQLKFLENEESWELLKKKVFRKERCPKPLEDTGKRIALKCNGLPLAVVVIAGVLDKNSTAAELESKKTPRRICVHSTVLDFLKSERKPSGEHVHSFLSFCSNEIDTPIEHLATIPKSFPILRVMDVESLKFKLLPKQLYELSYLKYLAVSTDLKLLPKVFSRLWNIQTLVFNTTENSLEVKADIWSMSKLRHVHSNTSMLLPPPPKNNSGSIEIQTLSTISPSSCTEEILEKTPNLQKLGIRGNLAELMESKGGVSLFDNLQRLDYLENLKLINNVHQTSKLRRFPHADKFPRTLRKMTLSNTSFEWKDLNILGSLDELEVLKLEENAFRGEFCDLSNIVFKQLQYLRIGRTNLLSWKVSKDSFPALKHLILRHCTALEAVPCDFAQVESLKVMELFCTNKKAATSAKEIQKLNGFQLLTYPPDH
nr:putative late blight resistance protein homolog R1B-14 [Ipomoea batatas]